MIKLKELLPEISLMSGDAGSDGLKDIFDVAFKNGMLPKKYRTLFWAGEDEAKNIPREYIGKNLTAKDKKEIEKHIELNKVTPEILAYLDKYEKVGSSGNYVMIMKKSAKELNFMLCDKTAKYLTDFFMGTIRAERGNRSYSFTSKKAFNLKTYQIHWSNIAVEHKGKGLGKLMYTMVYEYISGPLGAALVSDSMLFQGSQKMWMQYIPTIASYFGIVVEDVFFPIDKSEVGSDVMGGSVNAMVAMQTMPTEIRKLAYNVKGLSFKRGEYGVIRVREGINQKLEKQDSSNTVSSRWQDWDDVRLDKPKKKVKPVQIYFSDLVDESNSIQILLKKMDYDYDMSRDMLVSNTGDVSNLKSCVFSFTNMNVIIKQGAGKLVMIPI
jgi:hypothetical protein